MFVLVHQFLDRESNVDKPPDHGREEPEAVAHHMGFVGNKNDQASDDETPRQHHDSYRLFGMFALNERVGEEQAGRTGHTNGDGVSNVHQRAKKRVGKRSHGEKSGNVGGRHQNSVEEQKTPQQFGCQKFAPTVVFGAVSEQQGDNSQNGVDQSRNGTK